MGDPRPLNQQLAEAQEEIKRLKGYRAVVWIIIVCTFLIAALTAKEPRRRATVPSVAPTVQSVNRFNSNYAKIVFDTLGAIGALVVVGVFCGACGMGMSALAKYRERREKRRLGPSMVTWRGELLAPVRRPQRLPSLGRQTPIVNPEALGRLWRPRRD